MKILAFFFAVGLTGNALAASISCTNVDDNEEDSLEFYREGETTYAYYFDNDSYYSVPCETTPRDGYICEADFFTIRMYQSGETYVDYLNDPSVRFQCY